MKKIISFIFILFSIINLAQEPEIEWSNIYGGNSEDYPRYIQQTTDGGYFVIGYTWSHDGDVSGAEVNGRSDIWVLKLDSFGEIEWQKCLNFGLGYNEYSYSAQQTTDGGYIIAGYGEGGSSSYLGTGWIVKLDNIGQIEWDTMITGNIRLASIQQTIDGGYIISGQKNEGGTFGSYYYYVLKLDENGIIQWEKSYGGGDGDGISLSARSIRQTADGGFIVAGVSNENPLNSDSWHGDNDYWVLKLNSVGEIEWQKCYGGTNIDVAHSILETTDGGYIVAGQTFSDDGDVSTLVGLVNAWILKLNSIGEIEWEKTYGNGNERANCIIHTSDGGYIVAGYDGIRQGEGWVFKINSIGELQWTKYLGNLMRFQEAYSIQETSDNGYIVAIQSMLGGFDWYNYWIFKLYPDQMNNEENDDIINSFILYPNPTNDIVNFSIKLRNINIYDLNGELVYTENNTVSNIKLNNLTSGSYIIRGIKENGDKVYTKFIKK